MSMRFEIRGITEASCRQHCVFSTTKVRGLDVTRQVRSKGTCEFVERYKFQRASCVRDACTIYQGIEGIAIG